MRNITALAVLVIMFFCVRPAGALENYALSITPRFGVFYGHAEEIVYPSLITHTKKSRDDYLSQLLWDFKPVYYYGLDLDFSRRKPLSGPGFYSALSLKNAIPGMSGSMEDRDWKSTVDNALTNYSIHDNQTEQFFLLNAQAGLSLPFWYSFLFKLQLSFSYMRFFFSGIDGHGFDARNNPYQPGDYYPIDDNPTPKNFKGYGTVISYSQEWYVIAPGFSVGIDFSKHFYCEVFFQISPLIFCIDLDTHFTNRVQWTDYMTGGLFLEPRAVISFSANNWLTLSLEASYRYITKTRGKMYEKPMGINTYFFENGEAGAGLSLVDAALLLKIVL